MLSRLRSASTVPSPTSNVTPAHRLVFDRLKRSARAANKDFNLAVNRHAAERLGLPSVPDRMRKLRITELTKQPEVLFVIANHQPASGAFGRKLLRLPPREHADYHVATVRWMGYALFEENMKPLDEFIEELARGRPRA